MAASSSSNNVFEKPTPTHETYSVKFHGKSITTTVTNSGAIVSKWIQEVQELHERKNEELIVGLDVERLCRRRKGALEPVATLQLCVGSHCLIFQLLSMDYIPPLLADFLHDTHSIFVGVGIEDDVTRLKNEYELEVSKWQDLRPLAARKLGSEKYNEYGLKRFALEVLGAQMEKPLNVTLSDWGVERLSKKQVDYACIDAKVSFELGLILTKINK